MEPENTGIRWETANIDNRSVKFDPKNRYGRDYFKEIDPEERAVILERAKHHGSAEFETQTGKNYTLVRNDNGTYTINSRDN